MTTDSSSSTVFGALPVGATFRFVGNSDTYRKVGTEVAWCDATAASWAHIVPADRPVILVNDPGAPTSLPATRPEESTVNRIRFDCPTHGTNFLTGGIPCCTDAVADFDPSHYPTQEESTMSNEIQKASPSDAGCWIDGHWGQYGTARMVEIAAQHGYVDTAAQPPFATLDVVACASSVLRSIGPSGHEATDEEWNCLDEACDDVEEWLNENVAPEGFSFGWHDGEFFLQSQEWWSEEAY